MPPRDVRRTPARMALKSGPRWKEMVNAAASIASELAGDTRDFAGVVVEDAGKSKAAIALVLDQEKISSELVDNLNASIHLRALLTDLFLLSETAA